MRKLRGLLALLLVFLTLRWWACAPARDPGPEPDIAHRVWVDGEAKGPRDVVLRLVLVRGGSRPPSGAVLAASKFRVAGDRLRWKRSGEILELEILQKRQTARFEARAYRCDGPGRFDLCLDLKSGGRTLRLYSERRARFRAAEALGPLAEDLDAVGAGASGPSEPGLPAWFLERARAAPLD